MIDPIASTDICTLAGMVESVVRKKYERPMDIRETRIINY